MILARIALGSLGIRVGPADLPTPSSAERRMFLRDALLLTLWRPRLLNANGPIVGCRGSCLSGFLAAGVKAAAGLISRPGASS